MVRLEETLCMRMKPLRQDRVGDYDQHVVPTVLVTDLFNDLRVFLEVPGRIECPYQCVGNGVAEIVKLFMEPAAFPGSNVSQAMIEGTQSCPQFVITLQQVSYPNVDCPGARVAFHDNPDPDSPATGQQKGLRQPFIPEVICHPEDFTSGRNCMNAFFEEVTQATGWAVRASPENLEWRHQGLILGFISGDQQNRHFLQE
jgi:hypothetical protein